MLQELYDIEVTFKTGTYCAVNYFEYVIQILLGILIKTIHYHTISFLSATDKSTYLKIEREKILV